MLRIFFILGLTKAPFGICFVLLFVGLLKQIQVFVVVFVGLKTGKSFRVFADLCSFVGGRPFFLLTYQKHPFCSWSLKKKHGPG